MFTENLRVPQILILTGLMLVAVLAGSTPAAAVEGGSYSLEILVDGRPLAEYAARGKTYIEALEGRDYSLRLRNHTSSRIAVALSVDGLNTIDAKTTSAKGASKWILGPHETVTLEGWQTGPSTARRFFFTTEDRSYGSWLGKTSNLGVISAVVFREKQHRPAPIHRPGQRDKRSSGMEENEESTQGRARGEARADAGAESQRKSKERLAPQEPAPSDDLAATGIGNEFGHSVRRVRFNAEPSPAVVMEVRYEYHDALVRLGVLPRYHAWDQDPLSRRERARGFDGFDFAPDPYDPVNAPRGPVPPAPGTDRPMG